MLRRDCHIRTCGIFTHLLGVASARYCGADRWMGQAKSDRSLGKGLYRPVYQESELLRFFELPAERLALEAARPHIFPLKSPIISGGWFFCKNSAAPAGAGVNAHGCLFCPGEYF